MRKKVAYLLIFAMLLASVWMDTVPVLADITSDQVFEMWSGAATLNKGDTVEVYFHVYKYETSGFRGVLEYDPNVLSLAEEDIVVAEGGWNASYNKETALLEVMNDAGAVVPPLANRRILTIKFKVEKSAASTTIRLRDTKVYGRFVVGTDGSRDYGTVQTTINSTKVKTVTLATDSVIGEHWLMVPVRLTANDGFSSLTLRVTYDPACLSFESVTYAESIRNKLTESNVKIRSDGKAVVELNSSNDITATGDLMWLNFYAGSQWTGTAASTSATSVGLTVEAISGSNDVAYRTNEVFSTVTIGKAVHILGDVNGNDKVELLDALCVMQYYNNIRTLSAIEQTSADVNKDGKVDLLDAVYIIKYYNGEISSFNSL